VSVLVIGGVAFTGVAAPLIKSRLDFAQDQEVRHEIRLDGLIDDACDALAQAIVHVPYDARTSFDLAAVHEARDALNAAVFEMTRHEGRLAARLGSTHEIVAAYNEAGQAINGVAEYLAAITEGQPPVGKPSELQAVFDGAVTRFFDAAARRIGSDVPA
jgi:hypothetical protein